MRRLNALFGFLALLGTAANAHTAYVAAGHGSYTIWALFTVFTGVGSVLAARLLFTAVVGSEADQF